MRRCVPVLLAFLAVACPKARNDAGQNDAATVASASASIDELPLPSPPPAAESEPRKVHAPPTGAPPRLSCTSARALITDVEARLAAPPQKPTGAAETSFQKTLADNTLDWADPHGLWTASPDSPIAPLLRARAGKLRAVLEGKADCAVEMHAIGDSIARWVGELRGDWEAASKKKETVDATKAVFDGAFEDGVLTKPAKTLARELATRAAAAVAVQPSVATEVATGRDRWLPVLDADAWGEVVLAAAVRAYVPLIDPHGAWAPTEESATLYDRDLELAPPPRLWTTATRTALGVRIDAGPTAPLEERDVVLSIDGVTVAGLSAEAIDQLAEAPEGETGPRVVRVLRKRDDGPLRIVRVEVRATLADDPAAADPLPSESIPYGSGRALVLHLNDVPDALGDDLARAIAAAKSSSGPAISGIVLDLRGNGGGSIDGATGALGVFLSGAPLFPLKHRDGAIETERAAEPPVEDRWAGPVAAIVDGGTASAAEMIAGALHAYRRGAVVGSGTYGKGCAQEYVDDVTGVGVLRLTTLLFALPDGSAVQRIGLHPDVAIALPQPASVKDHEADLPRAAPTWSGPDVRDPKRVADVPWPATKSIGPCKDEAICRVLRALSSRGEVAKR